ncbi:iron complex transport system permease protein [Eubacterium pyruvativorans]|uniref:Iron complex transport system permease protein n=1 Tax=Eubacterium pyruvativorans TaxID=155865 RepID=A0A1I7EW36_9FIRM|nr:iron ABC transporter permease [Eubacterium pyruvativorans]SFN90214.1 iron complex transport system permease protein [Eubacterium pyruvativorans]SFU28122.1 iron complex transport system permease protein [Eubacterium pyruvativorans]
MERTPGRKTLDHAAESARETGYDRRQRARFTLVFLVLSAAAVGAAVLSIRIGNVGIPAGRILEILFTGPDGTREGDILWTIRLPRILTAALLGGALSLSGFLLQTFFGNPIAGPFVLGISSGAKLTVALTLIFFLHSFGTASSWTLIAAAFCGSLAATGFILLVARKVQNMAALLVAGIMIGYICSAVTDFVITFAEDSDIVNLRGWSLGSFSGMNWSSVRVCFLVVLPVFLLTLLLSKPISACQLGEDYAVSLGVNMKRFRILLIGLSSILSGCVTAFAGPISFVGIAVPFLVKAALDSAKPLAVIPGTFLGGAVFCMLSDLIARTAFSPVELNISTVTSVFGAPVVIFMMIRERRDRSR